MGVQLYSDALGFAIVQQGNRDLSWTPHLVREVLIAMVVISVLVLVAPVLLRGRSARSRAGDRDCGRVGVIGWNLTGELAAAAGTNSIARQAGATLKPPVLVGGRESRAAAPTLYFGQEEIDQNPEWLLEFWNRSIARRRRASTARSAGPGRRAGRTSCGTARSTRATTPHSARRPVRLRGRRSAVHRARGQARRHAPLSRRRPDPRTGGSSGSPIRTACRATAPASSRTAGAGRTDSVYYRFSGPGRLAARRVLAPRELPDPADARTITLGTMKTVDKQPALAQVTKRSTPRIGNLQSKVAWIARAGRRLRSARRRSRRSSSRTTTTTAATSASSEPRSAIASSADQSRTDEREAEAQDRPRKRPASLEQLKPAGVAPASAGRRTDA